MFLFITWLTSFGQTQQGFVKSIGRPNKSGVPLKDVTILVAGMTESVTSDSTGEFHLPFYNKTDGDTIKILRVYKNGFELNDKHLIGGMIVFSSRIPFYVTMVDVKQLMKDKRRIEEKATHFAEENYDKKLKYLTIRKEGKELSLEDYYQELRLLEKRHEHYLSLIEPMADRYARTDYDIIDSVDMEINVCIENGELEKADSLLSISKKEHLEGAEIPKEDYLKRIGFIQKMLDIAIINKDDVIRNKERYQQIANLLEIVADENLIQGNQKGCKK